VLYRTDAVRIVNSSDEVSVAEEEDAVVPAKRNKCQYWIRFSQGETGKSSIF